MFSPPPGYEDMLADARNCPNVQKIDVLEVPKVGAVLARRPMPSSIAALAQAANVKIGQDAQQSYLILFILDHLGEDEYWRLVLDIADEKLPANTMHRVARAIATWGTSRPYGAVVSLALATAHNWRTMRGRLITQGIGDPLKAVPSMHPMLDMMETIAVESQQGKDAKETERKRRDLLDKLYAPTPGEDADVDEEKVLLDRHTPPPGWDDEIAEAAFDIAAKTLK